jgi:hypothetical protein
MACITHRQAYESWAIVLRRWKNHKCMTLVDLHLSSTDANDYLGSMLVVIEQPIMVYRGLANVVTFT